MGDYSSGLSFRALRCHPEPFACHSERSEESRLAAQRKLCEEPVLNEVKESRSGSFLRHCEIPRRHRASSVRPGGMPARAPGARLAENDYRTHQYSFNAPWASRGKFT
jgi:hypothetical protein